MSFTVVQDKTLASQACLASWSPDKDLLAIVCRDQHVLLYRLNWQRLWSSIADTPPTALNWRPDGKALLTGHHDGSLVYRHVESGDVQQVISTLHQAPITCLSWVSTHLVSHPPSLPPSLSPSPHHQPTTPPLSDSIPSLSPSLSSPYVDYTHSFLPRVPPLSHPSTLSESSSLPVSSHPPHSSNSDPLSPPLSHWDQERWWESFTSPPPSTAATDTATIMEAAGTAQAPSAAHLSFPSPSSPSSPPACLTLLVSGDASGRVVVSAFGCFPLLQLQLQLQRQLQPASSIPFVSDLHLHLDLASPPHQQQQQQQPLQRDAAGSTMAVAAPHVVQALLSPDLSSLLLLSHSSSEATQPSSKDTSKDPLTATLQQQQQQQHQYCLQAHHFDTSLLAGRSLEAHALSLHGACLQGLASGLTAALRAMQAEWRAASQQWRERMDDYGRALRLQQQEQEQEQEGPTSLSPREDLLSFLASGDASPALQQFLCHTMGEQSIKRLARTIESAGNSLHALAALHLLPLLEETLLRLSLLAALLATKPAGAGGGRFMPFAEARAERGERRPASLRREDEDGESSVEMSVVLQRAMDEATAALAGCERFMRQLADLLPQYAAFFVWLLRCLRIINDPAGTSAAAAAGQRSDSTTPAESALLVSTQVVDSFLRHHLHADIIAQALDLYPPNEATDAPLHAHTHSPSRMHSSSHTQTPSEPPSAMHTGSAAPAAAASALPSTSIHSSAAVPVLSLDDIYALTGISDSTLFSASLHRQLQALQTSMTHLLALPSWNFSRVTLSSPLSFPLPSLSRVPSHLAASHSPRLHPDLLLLSSAFLSKTSTTQHANTHMSTSLVAFVMASPSSNKRQQQQQQEEEDEAGGGGGQHSIGSSSTSSSSNNTVAVLRCHWQTQQRGGLKAEQSGMVVRSEATEDVGGRESVSEIATAIIEGPWDIADLSFYKDSHLALLLSLRSPSSSSHSQPHSLLAMLPLDTLCFQPVGALSLVSDMPTPTQTFNLPSQPSEWDSSTSELRIRHLAPKPMRPLCLSDSRGLAAVFGGHRRVLLLDLEDDEENNEEDELMEK